MEKTKKWFRLLLFLPILLVIGFINIFVDPANVFHSDVLAVTEEILNGNAVYFVAGNTDERGSRECLIQKMPKDLDCITVGPSLSMGIRRGNVGTDNYYNLSASGLNYYDYMAVFGLLKYNNISFDKIIFCIDSYFFDENIIASDTRYNVWKEYAYYMEDILNGSERVRFPNVKSNIEQLYVKASQILSPTYFKASIRSLRDNWKTLLDNKRWGVVNDADTAQYAHYESDGSWTYAQSFINNTVEDVIKQSKEYDIKRQFGYGLHMSESRKDMFVKLIEYLISDGVQIEFYLCPPAPALYDRICDPQESDKYTMFDEIESFALEFAKSHGIKVTGTFDPYKLGIPNEDYLDSRHIRHEKLDQYFDFNF